MCLLGSSPVEQLPAIAIDFVFPVVPCSPCMLLMAEIFPREKLDLTVP
jgi:hypothetical protein